MSTAADFKRDQELERRVLIVEDNLDSVQLMATLVKMFGHTCEFAIHGSAALALARKFRPDVVLIDIALPDSNGCDIVRQLKREPEFKDTRFIAISALPERHYKEAALEAGCEEFHRKPVDPRKLEELLARR